MKREDDLDFEIMDDDLYERKHDTVENSDEDEEWEMDIGSIFSKGIKIPYVFLGVGILLLIVLFVIISRSNQGLDSSQIRLLESRIKQLEKKLVVLKTIDKRLATMAQPSDDLKILIDKVDKLETLLSKRTVTVPQREPASTAVKRAEALYHEVRSGETLYSISRSYGLTVDELLQLNKLEGKAVIQPGQRLLVSE
jgi:LysM repeat protein